MPVQAFTDYYRVLEVEPSASAQEIRRSFRRLVLRAHPDKNPHRTTWSERRIRELIEAYDVIGDGERRRVFDQKYRVHQRTQTQRPDESKLFFFRKSDPGCCAMRVLYMLLHRRAGEAVQLLEKMETMHGGAFLAAELDREDYLDCLFLLGEHFLEKRNYLQAFLRMRTFYHHERKARYPRHYLDAVVSHLKDLYLKRIPQILPPAEALEYLHEAKDLPLGPRERGVLAHLVEGLQARTSRSAGAARASRAGSAR